MARLSVSASLHGGSPAALHGAAAATIRSPSPVAPIGCQRVRAAESEMEQRNLLLAIVLSVGILIVFQFAFERMRPPQPSGSPPGTPVATSPSPATGSAPPGSGVSGTAPAVAPAKPAQTREAALAEQQRIKISTPRLHGSIDLLGARLDDLTLANYHETVDPKSPEVVLLSPPGTENPYIAEFGWVATTPDIKLPGPRTGWSASDALLTPTTPVTLTWDNGQGLLFTRTVSVDQDYMSTVRDSVHNSGDTPVKLSAYGLISRTGTPQVAGYYILFEGLIGYLDNSLQEVKYSSLTPGKPLDYGSSGWLGFTDKYWLTALIPPHREAIKARFTHTVG